MHITVGLPVNLIGKPRLQFAYITQVMLLFTWCQTQLIIVSTFKTSLCVFLSILTNFPECFNSLFSPHGADAAVVLLAASPDTSVYCWGLDISVYWAVVYLFYYYYYYYSQEN